MVWFKNLQNILKRSSELDLVYFIANHSGVLEKNTGMKARFTGAFTRFAIFIYRSVSAARTRSYEGPPPGSIEVLAYAESLNQMQSLDPVLRALAHKNIGILKLAKAYSGFAPGCQEQFSRVDCDLITTLKGILFSFWRVRHLIGMLDHHNAALSARYLDSFLFVYVCLVNFSKILNAVRPRLILLSNDINTGNRCLIAVARNLGIKTAYVQHAHVSHLFPPLGVDYAFLDGESALNIYRKVSSARKFLPSEHRTRHVFLSGLKKPIPYGLDNRASGAVGLAFNPLDDLSAMILLLDRLIENQYRVSLRWHPRTQAKVIAKLISRYKEATHLTFSDSRQEGVESFLEGVFCVIAGNSSIHLETALSGNCGIYFDFSEGDLVDYYGFVEHGIVEYARNESDLLLKIEEARAGQVYRKEDSLRYFSATYKTKWQGREGQLVADHLEKLSQGVPSDSLWGHVFFDED